MAQTYEVIYDIRATDNTLQSITSAESNFNRLKGVLDNIKASIESVKVVMNDLAQAARGITLNVDTTQALGNLKKFNEEALKTIGLLKQLKAGGVALGKGFGNNNQSRPGGNMGGGYRSGYYPPSNGRGSGNSGNWRKNQPLERDLRPPRRSPIGSNFYDGGEMTSWMKSQFNRVAANTGWRPFINAARNRQFRYFSAEEARSNAAFARFNNDLANTRAQLFAEQKMLMRRGLNNVRGYLNNPNNFIFDPNAASNGWTDWMRQNFAHTVRQQRGWQRQYGNNFINEAIARNFQYYNPATASATEQAYNQNLARMQSILGERQNGMWTRAERAHNRMRGGAGYDANYQKQWNNYLRSIGMSQWEWDNASRIAREMGMSERQVRTFTNRGWMPYVNPQTSDQVMANQHLAGVRNTLAAQAMARDQQAYNAALARDGGTGMIPYDPKKWNDYVRRSQKAESTRAAAANRVRNSNYAYKLIGPTPLSNNGGMAMEMLKGMGIMYGISLAGSLIHDIGEASVEYDNTMKTVENILKTHDLSGNFSGKFNRMSNVVRRVGMETKFKVTEVADAAKFLAMAGLNVDAISAAMRPIANIALVGDTDLGQTADLVTNIMTGYGIRPEMMSNAADIMTNTFTMSNTTLTEIAESYKYASTLMKAAGVPFEVATAAIGVLGDAGIKGSQAGTSLRMILNNIAKPTDKQQAAWDRLGVKTKDENGNIRNLLEIFEELASKDLKLEDYYSLFRVTAAPAAAALAQSTVKWRDVTMENYISNGLSNRLAEEKKNTISGLWAQLTSVFTDQGVKAFGGVQGYIRDILKKGIDLMMSDRTLKVLRELGDSMMSFFNILKDVSKYFIWFYETFGDMIKVWLQFQLVIWPVTKALVAFRTVFTGIGAIKNFAMTLRDAGIAMGFMKNKALEAKVATQAFNNQVVTPTNEILLGATKRERRFSNAGFWKRTWGRVNPQVMVYSAYDTGLKDDKNNPIMQARWEKGGSLLGRAWRGGVGNAVGLMYGAAAAYGAMRAFTQEDNNKWDKWAGGLFSGAGISAALTTANPWFLAIGAVLGGLGLGANVLADYERNAQAAKSLEQMLEQYRVEGNVIVDKNADNTHKWIDYVLKGTRDINTELELRIAHMKELMELETPGELDGTVNTDAATLWYKKLTVGKGDDALQKSLKEASDFLSLAAPGLSIESYGGKIGLYKGNEAFLELDRANAAYLVSTVMNATNGVDVVKMKEDFDKANRKYAAMDDYEGMMGLARQLKQYVDKSPIPSDFSEYVGKSNDEIKDIISDPQYMGNNALHKALMYRYINNLYGFDSPYFKAVSNWHENFKGHPEKEGYYQAFANYYKNIAPQNTIMMDAILDTPGRGFVWSRTMGWNALDSLFIPMKGMGTPAEMAQSVLIATEQFLKDMKLHKLYDTTNPELKNLIGYVEQMRAYSEAYVTLTQGQELPEDLRKTLNKYNENGVRFKYSDKSTGKYLEYNSKTNKSEETQLRFYDPKKSYDLNNEWKIAPIADIQAAQLNQYFNDTKRPNSDFSVAPALTANQAGMFGSQYIEQGVDYLSNAIQNYFTSPDAQTTVAGSVADTVVNSLFPAGNPYAGAISQYSPQSLMNTTGLQGSIVALKEVLVPAMEAEGLKFANTVHDAFKAGVLQALNEWGIGSYTNSFQSLSLTGYSGIGAAFGQGLQLYGQDAAQAMSNIYAGILSGAVNSQIGGNSQNNGGKTVQIGTLLHIEHANLQGADLDTVVDNVVQNLVAALEGADFNLSGYHS